MKCAPALLLIGTLLGTVALSGCNSREKPPEKPPQKAAEMPPEKAPETTPTPLTREDFVDVAVTAKVKAIDHATRIMTLEDAKGNQITITVHESVSRLNEVSVGDEVKTRYRARLLAELRAPTADETANPIAVVSLEGRSPTGATPAAGTVQATRVVTTVEGVDIPNMLVTLRGPMGDVVVVRGKKEENLKRLQVGDTIVITFTKSLGVTLEKIAPGA